MLQILHNLSSKSPQWEDIKLVYSSVQKPDRWYTGIPIKQFLKSNYFQLLSDFNNSAINSGRWSAYNHMSFAPAFRNIIAKYDLDNTSSVLVHPFLQQDAYTIIKSTGTEILTVDIELNSITFDPQKLFSHVRLLRSTQNINAVIFEDITGDLSSITAAVKLLNSIHIPSIVILNSSSITQDLLELSQAVQLGSIIWNFGGTFIDDALNSLVDYTFAERESWVSWHIETRTKSILEYHLSASQDIFEEFINIYLLLLIEKNKSIDFTLGVYFQLYQLLIMDNVYKGQISLARERIIELYNNLDDSAIPDIFWTIQHNKIEAITLSKIQEHDLYVRSYTQQLHKLLIDNLETYLANIKIPNVNISINRTALVAYSDVPQIDITEQFQRIQNDIIIKPRPNHSVWWNNKINMKNASQFSQHGYIISII